MSRPAGLAVAGGGVAIGATQLGDGDKSQAIVKDAAQQLGVQPSALSSALKKALENQVDAAVDAGQLTKAEGDALKARIESGEIPLFGPLGKLGVGPLGHSRFGFANLDAAASYLGLSESELRSQLESGKTLAQVARDRGKSVDGLVDALVKSAKEQLDAAVAAGKLEKSDEVSILKDLESRLEELVNGTIPGGFPFRGFRNFRHGPLLRGPTA